MKIEKLPYDFTVCRLSTPTDLNKEYIFSAVTDEEVSLVCKTCDVPKNVLKQEDGWRCFRICDILDFSLIGILADISKILADKKIGIFAVSTYNTDYIFVKQENFSAAILALSENEYEIF